MTGRRRLTQLTSEIFCIIAVICNLVVVSRSQGLCYCSYRTTKNVFVKQKTDLSTFVKPNYNVSGWDIEAMKYFLLCYSSNIKT